MENDSVTQNETKVVNKASIITQIVLNILFYVFVVFIIITGANKAFDFTYQIYGPVSVSEKPGKEKEVEIKKGTSAFQIADELYDNNLIKNKYSFFIRLKLSERTIVPNKYKLSTAMTYEEIIDNICRKDTDKDKEK